MTQAVVLAAGLGTRLRPLTEERPKPAVPLANRPLSWFTLAHLHALGVRTVGMNTHHLRERLPGLLAPHLPEGLEVRYAPEPELLGTGGGLRNAASVLEDDGEPFFVMNSDILFAPDLARALALHQRLGAIATMVLRSDPNAQRFGAIEVDAEGRVRRLLGEPADAPGPLSTHMFTGVHVLSREALASLPVSGCVIRQGYRRWLEEGRVVAGFVDESPWRDLGTPEAYVRTSADLASGRLPWTGIAADASGNLVAKDAEVPDDARLTECVVGPGARLAAGVRLERVVVWDGARVEESLADAVVTPASLVRLPSP